MLDSGRGAGGDSGAVLQQLISSMKEAVGRQGGSSSWDEECSRSDSFGSPQDQAASQLGAGGLSRHWPLRQPEPEHLDQMCGDEMFASSLLLVESA